jgi:hypothetical protein
MKTMFALLAAVVLQASAAFAGTRQPVTETLQSDPYHAIVIKGDLEVVLVPSDKFEVAVQGTAYQVKNVTVFRNNDTLYVTEVNKNGRHRSPARVEIRVKDLALLDVTGSTSVHASGYINTDILSIRANEGATVNLDVRALQVKTRVFGCGKIRLTGTSGDLTCQAGECRRMDLSGLDVVLRTTEVF